MGEPISVDRGTRADSEQAPVAAGAFFRETLPPLFDAHQASLVPGARELPLRDFCIEIEGEPWTPCVSPPKCGPGSGLPSARHSST